MFDGTFIPPQKSTVIKNAKPAAKPYKVSDTGGLYLLVKPNGSKYFRMKYRFEGKEKALALGVYPETSLKQARDKAYAARQQLSAGIDVGLAIQNAKLEKKAAIDRKNRIEKGMTIKNSFKEVALILMESIQHTNSPLTRKKKPARFENHIFTSYGNEEITSIKA